MTADAVNDEKTGAIFPATLTLGQGARSTSTASHPAEPGDELTAEIKTGKRRVIEYLLSPVQRAFNESLNER